MNPWSSASAMHNRLASLLPALTIAAGLTAAGWAQSEESQMSEIEPVYSAEEVQIDGVTVLELNRGGDHPLRARIAPGAGANLYSLVYDGYELLRGPEKLAEFEGNAPGNPVLYPTPNRVAGGRFSFEGRSFDFGLNDGDRFLHGLVRSVPWQSEIGPVDEDGVSVECWVDFAPGTGLYELFGFEHRLSLVYSLDEQGL
ncbi:MAG: hypothetical protein FVQ81_11790, partial [Candidatus Glassbacteria bacterium]|nr:hypothetical protein [Candidatus Glassbacteria bacterium]